MCCLVCCTRTTNDQVEQFESGSGVKGTIYCFPLSTSCVDDAPLLLTVMVVTCLCGINCSVTRLWQCGDPTHDTE